MQGLSAPAGAQVTSPLAPSFGQHWRTSATDCTRTRVNFERVLVICKAGEYRKCDAGADNFSSYGTAGVYSTRCLTMPVWRRCVSVEDGAATVEAVLSVTEDKLAATDEVPVEEVRTVKVKFVLEKECRFGQRFNVVGNDPLFGNWNPEASIPMDWSDGHIWSVQVDVPVSKQVEFKFVLDGQDGKIEWQPGPNRSFETVEDVSELVVNESWDFPSEDLLVEVSEELDSLGEETAPISNEELAVVTSLAGLDDDLKGEISAEIESQKEPEGENNGQFPLLGSDLLEIQEEISAEIESQKEPEGENNGQFPLLVSDLLEESETASEVPVADVALAATIVEAALKIDKVA